MNKDIELIDSPNARKEVTSNHLFECDFCSQSFQTKSERKSHVVLHFQSKYCGGCHRNLIRIDEDWYALHTEANCNAKHESVEWNSEDEKDLHHFMNSIDEDLFEISTSTDLCFSSDFSDISSSDNEIKVVTNVKLSNHSSPSKKIGILSNILDRNSLKAMPTKKNQSKTTQIGQIPLMSGTAINHNIEQTNQTKTRIEVDQQQKMKCDICNKLLLNLSTLRQHMKVVHDPITRKNRRDVFTCKICNRSLASKESLLSHIGTHTGRKRYFCDYCGHGVLQLDHLRQHLNTHTREKPFKCKLCNRGFSHRAQVAVHMRTHTGERPYKCSVDTCKWTFSRCDLLKRHQSVVHGMITKTFECHICLRIFPESRSLRRHMKSHSVLNNK